MSEPKSPKYCQVALKVPFADALDYACDAADLPPLGARVLVTLGRREKLVGVVVGHTEQSAHKQVKAIGKTLDEKPLFSAADLTLLRQAARYYQVALGEMIMTALPAWYRTERAQGAPVKKAWQALVNPADVKADFKQAPKQWLVLDYLYQHGPLSSAALGAWVNSPSQLCRALVAKGVVEAVDEACAYNRNPVDPQFQLTQDQQKAFNALQNKMNGFSVSVLDGITGSGKTEVYIRLIQGHLAQQKQVLVLVPEIGLTPQLFQEINHRIDQPMAVLHSGLTDAARARVWHQAKAGQVKVVVATRSGIFTPFQNLGCILVDEEHDLSYKQQDGVRYSARDLAALRGKICDVPVLLGSATPSLETLNHAQAGRYDWLRLRERTNQNPLPRIQLQNTQAKTLKHGLTHQTLEKIEAHINRGNQVLVFMNRRGWAPKLICRDCGWVADCDDCEAYLTYHKRLDLLLCHHCDRRYIWPEFCPACGSQELDTLGVGTEKIATGLAERLGEDMVLRMDRDTVKTPKQWQQKLKRIRSEAPCAIVGTQMLAKGHDFPKLSLVVVVNVDNSFYSTDFRATEHLAQLMVQVSGRAGRADTKGEVVVQTQFPDHPFFQTLLGQGYESFAENQLAERESLHFPPASHMAIIRASHRHMTVVDGLLQQLADACDDSQVSVMGPLPAPVARKQKMHRMQLILNAADRKALHQNLQRLRVQYEPTRQKAMWYVDIDPVTFD